MKEVINLLEDKYKICCMCKYFNKTIYVKEFVSNNKGVFADGEIIKVCTKKNCNVTERECCNHFVYDEP